VVGFTTFNFASLTSAKDLLLSGILDFIIEFISQQFLQNFAERLFVVAKTAQNMELETAACCPFVV